MEITISPSKLYAFETCPKQFHLKYIQKAIPYQKFERNMHIGTLVHKIIELLSEYPVMENIEQCTVRAIKEVDCVVTPDMVKEAIDMVQAWFTEDKFKCETLSSEMKFKLDLDVNVTINGIIDRVEKVSDKCIRVIDYKTGFKIYNREDMHDSNQLIIYAMAVYDKWPVETLIIRYDMVRYGRVVDVMVNFDDFKQKYEYLKIVYNKIMSGEKIATVSSGCAYCGYKYNCKEYTDYIKAIFKIENMTDVMNDNFSNIIHYVKDLDEKQKVLEEHIKEIKHEILNQMISSGTKTITQDDVNVIIITPNKREYDTKVVAEIFKDNLSDVMKPVKSNVDKLMTKKTVEERALILATSFEVGGSPYLRIKVNK